MLELGQLIGDLSQLSKEARRGRQIVAEQLDSALGQAGKSGDEWKAMAKRIREANTKWLNAVPLSDDEPIAVPIESPAPLNCYTVVATDGSQIPLDRHAPLPYFVINVGQVALHYGTGERPALSSDAKLYYRDEDLLLAGADGESSYVGERQVAAIRTMHETQALSKLMEDCADRDRVLALVDGTLVLWAQEGDAESSRKESVRQILAMLATARRAGALAAGYISRPRSREVVNALKVTLYPEGVTNYNEFPTDQLPFGGLARLTDAVLFNSLLEPGQRSTVFESQSRILGEYEAAARIAEYENPRSYRIAFFYVKVGEGATSEIARVECPLWLAEDAVSLSRLHALVVNQAVKGRGYPVALQEAHEHAIVRAPERAAFAHLIEKQCVRDGIVVTTSQKALAKQVRFV